jgi:hypothetical protein
LKKGTWILLGIVLALVAAILLWERRQPSTSEREEGKLKPFAFKKDDVKSLARAGSAPLALTKGAEGDWELTAPVKDKGDRYGVEGFLERIADAKAVRWVQAGGSAKELGLDPPRAVWELKGDKFAGRLEVGARAAFDEGLYVRAGSKLALLPTDFESLLLRPVSEFRSKELTRVPSQEARTLSFTRPDGTAVAFEHRRDSWDITHPFEDWGSSERIQLVADDVCACPVFGFADDSPSDLKRYGLDPGQRSITIGLAGGKKVEVRLGASVPGTDPKDARVYGWSSDRPSVMIVSLNSIKSLDQDLEAFRSLSLFRRDPIEAEGFEVTGLFKIRESRDDKGTWTFEAPKPAPAGADPSVLPLEFLDLRGERAVPAGDAAALGLSQPDLTVTVKGKGSEEKAVVGVEKDGRRYARAAGRSAALLLPKEEWERIEAALRLVSGQKKPSTK